MSVGRICAREVDLVGPDESVQAAAQRMHARMVGTLVVLDDKKHPVGLVTDRDLAVRVLAEGRDAGTTTVEEVMTTGLKTVNEDCPIEAALEIMRGGPFRRVPVVDENGCLEGLVSIDDVLDLLAEEFQSIGRLVKRESPRSLAGR